MPDLASMGLMPPAGMGMPGMPPTTGPTGVGEGGMPDAAMGALDALSPKSPNPTAAMQKIEQAFDLAHKLVMTALPQLSQWNPKAAQQAHAAAKTLLSIKSTVRQEAAPQPPPDLMLGMGAAGTGSPLGPSTLAPGT